MPWRRNRAGSILRMSVAVSLAAAQLIVAAVRALDIVLTERDPMEHRRPVYHALCVACIGEEVGIHDVPEPIRSCEMPSGPIIMFPMVGRCCMPGMLGMSGMADIESGVAHRVEFARGRLVLVLRRRAV